MHVHCLREVVQRAARSVPTLKAAAREAGFLVGSFALGEVLDEALGEMSEAVEQRRRANTTGASA